MATANGLPREFNTIDTVEQSINLPKELQGDDIVIKSEDNTEILYRGWFTGLHFDGLNIKGNAVIRKIQRTKKLVSTKTKKVVGTRKLFGIFTINIYEAGLVEEKVVNETVLAEAWSLKPPDWCHQTIIDDGKPVSSEWCGNYWVGIVSDAANKGIVLSVKLRPAIFASVEHKLVGFYQQVKQFASNPTK